MASTEISLEKLFAGDRRMLSRAITLIESKRERDHAIAQQLLEQAMPKTGDSLRIGITGAPGVGKSTLIDTLGMLLVGIGKKLAVLAVDPSSPKSGGSVLGDKTRMEQLSKQENAFIRPSPSNDSLGGVAQKTREAMLLCEAAGFDLILIETVGVGQSEVDVASMVDFFAVVMLPNAGDELQGIKRGIIEFADAVVINKADGESVTAAERARGQFQSALRLIKQSGVWSPRAITCSALKGTNVDELWRLAEAYREAAKQVGEFELKRSSQNADWMEKLLRELIDRRIRERPEVRDTMMRLEEKVRSGKMTPSAAVSELDEYFQIA